MPPKIDKQFDKLIRSALVASVKGFQPSDKVWEQIQRKYEAAQVHHQPKHYFIELHRQQRWLSSVSNLLMTMLLRGLGLISDILFTERVALLGYRLEGSASDMLSSM